MTGSEGWRNRRGGEEEERRGGGGFDGMRSMVCKRDPRRALAVVGTLTSTVRGDGSWSVAVETLTVTVGGDGRWSAVGFFQSQRKTSVINYHISSNHMAEEELVDQKKYLEDSCRPKCVKPLIEYEACMKRIEGHPPGDKHCTGQYFDYISCLDKCVAPKLFSELK